MAYGHGRKDTMKRAVEAGRVALPDPHHPLLRIRAEVRALAEEMAVAAWSNDPAAEVPGGKPLYDRLAPISKASWLNAVWAQAPQLLVMTAVAEAHARRARHLFGILKNIDKRKDGVLVNVPEGMRDGIDPHALRAFAARLRAAEWVDLMRTASAAFRGTPEAGLTQMETDLLRAACDAANAKFSRPTWDGPRADRAAVRLNLDARSVRGGAAGLAEHLETLNAAALARATGAASVPISGPEPRADAIVLPVRLRPLAASGS